MSPVIVVVENWPNEDCRIYRPRDGIYLLVEPLTGDLVMFMCVDGKWVAV